MGEECGINDCAVRLKDCEKLEMHRFSHQGEEFICPECRATFPTWPKCAMHLWRSHAHDMELFWCDECDYRSFTLAVLEKHKATHCEDKPFLCPDCGRAIKNEKQLQEHMKTVHRKRAEGETIEHVDKFECDICQIPMSSAREVRYHKERVHDGKKKKLCVHCGFSAYSNSSLKLHMRSHTGDKPFACQECKYSTSDHNSLRRHLIRHSGSKPYKCSYCPYAAIQSSGYKKHMKKKHPDKAGDVFQCKECPYATVQENLFKAHSVSHTQNSDKENQLTNRSSQHSESKHYG